MPTVSTQDIRAALKELAQETDLDVNAELEALDELLNS